MITRPMLAGSIDDAAKLPFPLIASPKIDGIRALTIDGHLWSRSMKRIPNRFICETLERVCPDGLDGELLSGSSFQDCTSAIMSHEGEPSFTFACFDWFGDSILARYDNRLAKLQALVPGIKDPRVMVVPTQVVASLDELLAYETKALAEGFEGVMLRRPEGPYKQGRSTLREGYLLKLKRFQDSEAVIVGFEELMHNDNAAQTNELGLTKRSSAKAGKRPAGTLGALICRRLVADEKIKATEGPTFGIGAGLTEELRAKIWAHREELLGQIVKFKHQPFGEKDAPRLPVFLGFRASEDMG